MKKLDMILIQKLQKYQPYGRERLTITNILQVKKYYLLIKKKKKAKFTYFLLHEAFEKQIETIEYERKEHVKAIEEHQKQKYDIWLNKQEKNISKSCSWTNKKCKRNIEHLKNYVDFK